jgi:hypothetical protein
VILGIAIGVPRLIPPVPLRVQSAVFTSELDRNTLVPADTLSSTADPAHVGDEIYLLFEVFSPAVTPATVTLEWKLDGQNVRTTRGIEITAHVVGFRVWDGWRPEEGAVPSGEIEVVLRSSGGRVFGRATIRVGE